MLQLPYFQNQFENFIDIHFTGHIRKKCFIKTKLQTGSFIITKCERMIKNMITHTEYRGESMKLVNIFLYVGQLYRYLR